MSRVPVVLPQINVNDTEGILLEWSVERGGRVEVGDTLCEVETTKANVEVDVEAAGYLYPAADEDSTVKVGAVIGWILDQPDDAFDPHATASSDVSSDRSDTLVSHRAAALLAQHGLTTADLPPGLTAVRERDVLAVVAARAAADVDAVLAGLDVPEGAVALYGAGRHGEVILDTLRAAGVPVAVFLDDRPRAPLAGVPVVAAAALDRVLAAGIRRAHVCIADPAAHARSQARLAEKGFELVHAIHPSAYVSPAATLGPATFVGPQAVVGPAVTLGAGCHVNNGATVAHHSALGDHARISDGAHLGGAVTIGARALIGIGANVNKDCTVGEGAVVVSGATVYADVPAGAVVREDNSVHTRAR